MKDALQTSRVEWLGVSARRFSAEASSSKQRLTCTRNQSHNYIRESATMASIRTPTIALRSGSICRQCARSLARRPLFQQGGRAHLSQQPWRFKDPYSLQHGEIKTDYKLPKLETKVYSFEQVKKLSESPSSDQILIGKLAQRERQSCSSNHV